MAPQTPDRPRDPRAVRERPLTCEHRRAQWRRARRWALFVSFVAAWVTGALYWLHLAVKP